MRLLKHLSVDEKNSNHSRMSKNTGVDNFHHVCI